MTSTQTAPKRTFAKLFCFVISFCALISVTHAETAAKNYQQGITAFKAARFEEAVSEFRRALDNTSEPVLRAKIHLQLGVVYSVLKRHDLAKVSFIKALQHDTSINLPKDAKRHIRKSFNQLKQRLKGTLSVSSDQQGAKVYVDGHEIGPAPTSSSVGIGRHKIAVRLDGFVTWKGNAIVFPQKHSVVEAILLPIRSKLPTASTKHKKSIAVIDTNSEQPTITTKKRQAPRSIFWLVSGISSAALASGALTVGIAFDLKSQNYPDDSDDWAKNANLGLAGYITAGVFAVVSGVSWYLYWRSNRTSEIRSNRANNPFNDFTWTFSFW